jgi:hypothetical protein
VDLVVHVNKALPVQQAKQVQTVMMEKMDSPAKQVHQAKMEILRQHRVQANLASFAQLVLPAHQV